jgi:hypothetical protein
MPIIKFLFELILKINLSKNQISQFFNFKNELR